MARTVRDTSLGTRTARADLAARKKPYWRSIDPGCHVGYYKGKRGGSWTARYFLGEGRYAEKKLGTADDTQDATGVHVLSFKQAQEKAREWFDVQARNAKGLPETDGPYTVSDAIEHYLADCSDRGVKAVAQYRQQAEALILPALGNVEVSELTTERIKAWRSAIAKTPARLRTRKGHPQKHRERDDGPEATRRRRATANRITTILRAALNHSWREGKVSNADTWRRIKPYPETDVAKVRYLSADECARLANACEPDFRQLVQGALLTGCRYGELTVMQCGDFDPDAGIVTVRTSKSGKTRHVPLNDEGVGFFTTLTAGRPNDALMFLRADGQPWGRSHQRRPMALAAKIAKIEDVSFHVLRHTYGSALAMQGVPMAVIAHALGHSDTRMTEKHYAALAPSYVADTIRTNLPALGIIEPGNIEPMRRRK